MTDVTGFGLAGHLLEICRGSKLAAQLHWDAIPLIEEANALAKQGVATILEARRLRALAFGSAKREAVRRVLEDP